MVLARRMGMGLGLGLSGLHPAQQQRCLLLCTRNEGRPAWGSCAPCTVPSRPSLLAVRLLPLPSCCSCPCSDMERV